MMINATHQAIATPTLWVEDLISAQHLSVFFRLIEYRGEIPKIVPGQHYILCSRETPEAHIKAIAWSIQAANGECRVYGINNTLENLVNDKLTGRELVVQILEFARPYEDWASMNDEVSSTIKQAAEIAKVAIALLPETEKIIELGILRERCHQSLSYWSKLVSRLESEFKRELERRGLAQSNDIDEHLKLDLLALLKEPDPIKKLRKRSDICSFYRLKTSDVEQALKLLSKRTYQEEVKVWGLDELFALESEGLQWLIPELLPKGETIILAAMPKAGKTLLAIDAAFAFATGESEFLGQTVQRGKVLLISCDESLNSTSNKLLKRGFRSHDQDIRVIPNWTIDDLDVLEAQLEDFRPDVVIIDSLRRITHGSPISENSAEFADNIYTLKETIGRYGASGILIHHTNKNSEAMGVGKLRGSSAIAGAVWGTWQLDHIPKQDPNNNKKMLIDPSDPRRALTVFARDTEGQCLNIEFNPEDNSWNRLDEDIQVEQQTFRERIINVLIRNAHVPGLSGGEIIELLGMTPSEGRSVYTELNRMVNKRLIGCKPACSDRRINIYSLPYAQQPTAIQDSPPTLPINPTVEHPHENFTQHRFGNTQQLLNNHLMTGEENQAVDYLNQMTASDSEILKNDESSKTPECVSPTQLEFKYVCEKEIANGTQIADTSYPIPFLESDTTSQLKIGQQVKISHELHPERMF